MKDRARQVVGDSVGIRGNVFGVGRANVDINAFVESKFLLHNGLMKGRGNRVTPTQFDQILRGCKISTICTGGCIANTIAALADEGVRTRFFGRVGGDTYGDAFVADFLGRGILLHGLSWRTNHRQGSTGRCLVLITPDGERTFAFVAGVAEDIGNPPSFDSYSPNYDFLLFEGNLLCSDSHFAAFLQIREDLLGQNPGLKTVLSLHDCGGPSTASCVHFLERAITFSDILVGNTREFRELRVHLYSSSGKRGSNADTIVIETRGMAGVVIHEGNFASTVPVPHIERMVDTVGAGDSFLAGFIFGLLSQRSLVDAAYVGTVWATRVLHQIGGRPPIRSVLNE